MTAPAPGSTPAPGPALPRNPIRQLVEEAQDAFEQEPPIAGEGPANEPGPPERPDLSDPATQIMALPKGGWGGLPEGCPVKALGHKRDTFYYFSTPSGGFKVIKDGDFSKQRMTALYGGNLPYLMATWPRLGNDGSVNSFHNDVAMADHIAECVDKGPWDPANSLRGVGWFAGEDGELVCNFGDVIIIKPADPKAKAARTRERHIGNHIYLLGKRQVRPWGEPVDGTPAANLLSALGTWNWARPKLDPVLLLGWIVSAMLGGALKWRPLVWLTGDMGTGKSTINGKDGWLEMLLGSNGITTSSDATAAGIWQSLEFDSLPLAIDELEAGEDPKKTDNVIKFARQAGSGGVILRGGQDHQGVQFPARSCFAFSSINPPPLRSADLSRIAMLELGPLKGSTPPLKADDIHKIGAQLRRRIIDRWPWWNDTFLVWRQKMTELGYSARTADQFGTLLAAADFVLHEAPPDADTMAQFIADTNLASLAEQTENRHDYDRCLEHFCTTPTPVSKPGRPLSVVRLLKAALGRDGSAQEAQERAIELLEGMGIKLVLHGVPGTPNQARYVALANDSQGLAQLFAGGYAGVMPSPWAGRPGASSPFVRTLRRVPGALHLEKEHGVKPLWFNGRKSRVTLLPLTAVVDEPVVDRDPAAEA